MQTLLLVEDQPEKMKAMERVATGAQRRVLKSLNRAEALTAIDGEKIDLVVTDLALDSLGNDRDGLDVLRAARKKDPEVPVILISAYLTADDAEQAIDEGAFDIIDRASQANASMLLRLKINQALRFREALQSAR